MDYTIWSTRELIERIEELEAKLHIHETCKGCGDPLYDVIRVHHHTDSITGEDITK
jgi:hypothetical protein